MANRINMNILFLKINIFYTIDQNLSASSPFPRDLYNFEFSGKYDRRIESRNLFETIINKTPSVAVITNSLTISISTTAITPKPIAFASKAVVPGIKRLLNANRDDSSLQFPLKPSFFHALTIWTAWEIAIENIKNGIKIDMGSKDKPKIGIKPSNHTTGTNEQIRVYKVNRKDLK